MLSSCLSLATSTHSALGLGKARSVLPVPSSKRNECFDELKPELKPVLVWDQNYTHNSADQPEESWLPTHSLRVQVPC